MTKKAPTKPQEPKFHPGQRVVYDAWMEVQEMRNVPAVVLRLEDCHEDEPKQLYSRKNPARLVWWYHATVVGDKYPRAVCEDELSLPPPAKFRPGNLVDFDAPNPKFGEPMIKGSGIVVGVHVDEDYVYSYDVWPSDSDLKTPFKVSESCLRLIKKPKKDKKA